jgi:enediyne biosynthesis protein E4
MTLKLCYLAFTAAAAVSLACAPAANVSNDAPAADSGSISFEDVTAASGVNFTHIAGRTDQKHMPEIMGSGVAIADFNRDGAPDIYLVNSGRMGVLERPEEARDKLFLNDGKGNFRDASAEWNVGGTGYGQGIAVGDFDNDGWPDVFLTSFEGNNRLLRNTGNSFAEVTPVSGLAGDGQWATSAAFLDYDNDGLLDLYIVRYIIYDPANPRPSYRNRMLIYSTPINYEPVADQLWKNIGGGKFRNVTDEAGIGAARHNGLALGVGDIDLDGDIDIYLANDSDANNLWINDGGTFRDIAQLAGAAYSELGIEEGSMGVDFSDVTGNGRLDIAVTNFQTESTSLYTQIEPLLFKEVSDAIGIGETARQRLKFGIDLFDVDNDGDEDMLVANGHIEDNVELNSDTVTFAQPNTLYEAIGEGRFRDITERAGSALKDVQVSRGLATGDLNGDGLLDFVITNNGGTAQVAFNRSQPTGNFVILWLEGAPANRSAIGARVTARIGDRTIERQVMGAQSYLSISDLRLHFGLGDAEAIDELTIHWPGGDRQSLTSVGHGKFYHIRQGAAPVEFIPGERQILP